MKYWSKLYIHLDVYGNRMRIKAEREDRLMLISFIQVCDGQPTKATRMMQAEEAVSRIKVKNTHIHTLQMRKQAISK